MLFLYFQKYEEKPSRKCQIKLLGICESTLVFNTSKFESPLHSNWILLDKIDL